MGKYGYVDVEKLCDCARNQTTGLTANHIMRFPRADVQPVRRGKWLHFNDDGFIFCSECHKEAYWDTDYGQQLFDYCPYCGAQMLTKG